MPASKTGTAAPPSSSSSSSSTSSLPSNSLLLSSSNPAPMGSSVMSSVMDDDNDVKVLGAPDAPPPPPWEQRVASRPEGRDGWHQSDGRCIDGRGSGPASSSSSSETSALLSSSRNVDAYGAPDNNDNNNAAGSHLTLESTTLESTMRSDPSLPRDVEFVFTATEALRDNDHKNVGESSELEVLLAEDPDSTTPDGACLTRRLVRQWVLKGMLAPAAVTYAMVPALHWTTLVASAFFAPVLAIVQGSLGILQFRVRFGKAPVPVAPSHGVVFAQQQQQQDTRPTVEEKGTFDEFEREYGSGESTTLAGTTVPRPMGAAQSTTGSIDDARHLSPVRLLVIGDSLAIGVGQRYSSFPVLPSAIARTLSAKLGRVVYWTCHGAPGASTGWIVRELERGVSTPDPMLLDEFHDGHKQPPSRQSSLASSSIDGSDAGSSSIEASDPDAAWRKRLTAHRKRFNPDRLGPYDIVVVLTGSNDLKSAFFPFLLTGEDAEFRRQAKERGGNYNKELRRLVETLYDKMKIQFQTLRESIQTGVDQMMTQVEAATESVRERVEQATESVRERVEETIERIRIPSGSGRTLDQLLPTFPPRKPSTTNDIEPSSASAETVPLKGETGGQGRGRVIDASSTTSTDESAPDDEDELDDYESLRFDVNDKVDDNEDDNDAGDDEEASVQRGHSRHYPLVVLPGMPSRALPIFGTVPLRWLACPIVDIMDRHKHDLAALHPGHVLFVPAPTWDDVRTYETHRGDLWNEKCQEDVLLNLHDPARSPGQDAALESSMQQYYGARTSWTVWKQSKLFAEDQIHPNDDGYDFWGRYIGRAIHQEWQAQQQQQQQQPCK